MVIVAQAYFQVSIGKLGVTEKSLNMTQSEQTFDNPYPVHRTFLARWFPGLRIAKWTPLRIAGMVPVALVLGAHAILYLTAVPGTLIPLHSTFPFIAPVILVIFHILFISTLFNYLLLVFIDPGSPPDDWKAPPPSTFFSTSSRSQRTVVPNHVPSFKSPMISNAHTTHHDSNSVPRPPPASTAHNYTQIAIPMNGTINQFQYAHLMHERTSEGYLRYCRICKAYKPDRSHHCSVCKRCILRMDHHCVFVNNCVSFYNHKFFVSFVGYAFLGSILITVVSFPTFADVISVPSRSLVFSKGSNRTFLKILESGSSLVITPTLHIWAQLTSRNISSFSAASRLSTTMKTVVMIGYIVSSALSFALGVFVSIHSYLLAKGRTTIEMYEVMDPVRGPVVNQYDLGLLRNIRGVCGTVPLCWLCPTRAFIDGDGLQYERQGTSNNSENNI